MLKGFVSGEEKDITRIPMWTSNTEHEGWEVRDNQDRLIWGREDEFEGTDSIPIKGYGTPLTSVVIKGNGQQTGTPTPDAPIMPTFCGVRTGNLFDYDIEQGTISSVGVPQVDDSRVRTNGFITLDVGTYTLNAVANIALDTFIFKYKMDGTFEERIPLEWAQMPYTFNVSERQMIKFVVAKHPASSHYRIKPEDVSNIMLNLGSTPLPYEPYGWKIPITCASVTTPLYLGEVSTVRKIRKLVLTASGNTFAYQGYGYYPLPSDGTMEIVAPFCDKLAGTMLPMPEAPNNAIRQTPANIGGTRAPCLTIKSGTFASQTAFNNWITQYSPTVWYVLATPETAIINEPLMKIGDYADTLTTTTPIPTTTGATDVTVDTKIPPSELTIKVHAKKIRYGFKIDKSNDDSEDAVIYTHDAVTMTPAHMDFTNDRFDYGSWGNAFFVRDCYPVALNLDGTEAYRLDPDDYTKKLDGTPSDIFYELLTEEPSDWSTQWKQYYTKSGDDYTLNDQAEAPTFATNTYYKLTYNSSFTGNFMVEFPQVWFYRHEDTSYNYIEISNYKLSDDWKCYSHINKDGTLVDRIYLPMFKGVIVDNKLRSIPGVIPQGNTSATTEVNAATALGSRWQIWDHSSAELINDLLTLMSKSIDSQGKFGQGRSTGYNSADTVTYGKLQSGTLIKKGKFHGYSATTKEVKVFGIEGFWANRWDRLQGMLLVNNVWKIKMTPPYNFTGTDFVTLSNAEVPSGNGYLSKVQTSEYGSIPASIANGSSTKYFKDYFYKTATGTRVASRGGRCGLGSYAGFRFVSVGDAASASDWNIGASPVYK